MPGASPDAACPGLYQQPLDATIGRLIALYRPGGYQGPMQNNNDDKIHLLRWPF